jgi:hypothetical protein
MAINFPSSPIVGQTLTSNNITWMWDGTTWTSSTLGSYGNPFKGTWTSSKTFAVNDVCLYHPNNTTYKALVSNTNALPVTGYQPAEPTALQTFSATNYNYGYSVANQISYNSGTNTITLLTDKATATNASSAVVSTTSYSNNWSDMSFSFTANILSYTDFLNIGLVASSNATGGVSTVFGSNTASGGSVPNPGTFLVGMSHSGNFTSTGYIRVGNGALTTTGANATALTQNLITGSMPTNSGTDQLIKVSLIRNAITDYIKVTVALNGSIFYSTDYIYRFPASGLSYVAFTAQGSGLVTYSADVKISNPVIAFNSQDTSTSWVVY